MVTITEAVAIRKGRFIANVDMRQVWMLATDARALSAGRACNIDGNTANGSRK